MSSFFNDPQKLAAAKALAQSFKSGHDFTSKKKKNSCPWGHKAGAVSFVEVKELVPPSKRQYDGNALKTGWHVQGIGANAPEMSSAIDFLRRVDQVATKASDTPAPEAQKAAAPSISPASSKTTGITTPSAGSLHDSKGEESRAANDDQRHADEANAERLANLLESFSFKEADIQENSSGSILETFLALLAENGDLNQELEDTKTSCIRGNGTMYKSKTSETGVPTLNDLPKPKPDCAVSEQRTSHSQVDDPQPPPQKSTSLRPNAHSFVPSGTTSMTSQEPEQAEQNFPFTGHFDKMLHEGVSGHWPPVKYRASASPVAAIPVNYTVWVPVQPLTTDHLVAQDTMISVPAKPMRGLSASKWATKESAHQ